MYTAFPARTSTTPTPACNFLGDNNIAVAYSGGSRAGALGVTFSNDSFQYLYDDSLRGAGSNELIANNNFYSNHPDPTDTDHPDYMQLWDSGDTAVSYNIEDIGNVGMVPHQSRGVRNLPVGCNSRNALSTSSNSLGGRKPKS